ncbi:HAD family hydrolase [Allosphingosinicella deserti]|uniref:Hydrolase n=1 Tax=Allosphingosinicella deserti TaxID=2116704 RepID=A0A2P7QZ53_9SPHN|nr:HAD family hydrolase [Sphingomonas deserti]PSJ43236.1 hydrolase [Sphingomonas deserti]
MHRSSILPHQLPTALDHNPEAAVLSLDCFDTLLWRNVHQPDDVFADLVQDGIDPGQRIMGERRARTEARINEERHEVTFKEIYTKLMTNADDAVRSAAIARELAAEARHCFPFRPTVELMDRAKAQGLKVIIVSDTYLDNAQLTELLRLSAGEDVLALIDRIFCSSDYGKPKAAGLFVDVLAELGVEPARILHLGDNPVADFDSPSRLGISALHLVQFDEATKERLRLETVGASVFNAAVRGSMPAYQPHRAGLSIAQPLLSDPTSALGYAALGPVFYGFGRWLLDEAADLEQRTGKPVRMLFLLRDGHLPHLVHQAIAPESANASRGEISRLTSSAATLTTEDAVTRYAKVATLSGYPADYTLARLLFPPAEANRIIRSLPKKGDQNQALFRYLSKPQTIDVIMRRSRAFCDRMIEHVRAATGIQPGETLMLVDLGYNGSVQNRVDRVLAEALGVHVAGRYLLLAESEVSGLDKKGFMDRRNYDDRALDALGSVVAVIEQLATVSQGSVIDYDPGGSPIRRDYTISDSQTRTRDRVQAACVQFARDVAGASHRRPQSDDVAWTHGAAATLIRLMFLPTKEELAVLEAFDHDINLGTSSHVKLFDPEVAERELKRRGPFYLKHSERMYLPAELRGQGFPLTLMAMASWRLRLDVQHSEFSDRHIVLPVMIADGNELSESVVHATPTHEGFFVATIPVGSGRFAIGAQFAKQYEWLQIEAVWFTPASTFLNPRSMHASKDFAAPYHLEGIEEVAPGLLKCTEEAGFLLVPPPPVQADVVLHIAFRPIAPRVKAPVTANPAEPALVG